MKSNPTYGKSVESITSLQLCNTFPTLDSAIYTKVDPKENAWVKDESNSQDSQPVSETEQQAAHMYDVPSSCKVPFAMFTNVSYESLDVAPSREEVNNPMYGQTPNPGPCSVPRPALDRPTGGTPVDHHSTDSTAEAASSETQADGQSSDNLADRPRSETEYYTVLGPANSLDSVNSVEIQFTQEVQYDYINSSLKEPLSLKSRPPVLPPRNRTPGTTTPEDNYTTPLLVPQDEEVGSALNGRPPVLPPRNRAPGTTTPEDNYTTPLLIPQDEEVGSDVYHHLQYDIPGQLPPQQPMAAEDQLFYESLK